MADITPLLSLVRSQARFMGVLYEDGTIARQPIPVQFTVKGDALENSAPIAFPKFTQDQAKAVSSVYLTTAKEGGDTLLKLGMRQRAYFAGDVIAWDTGKLRISLMGVETNSGESEGS